VGRVDFTCRNNMPGLMIFLSIFYVLFKKNDYIRLERVA
jgi:hypothetical protein